MKRVGFFACVIATLLPGSGASELAPSSFALLAPRSLNPGFLDAAGACRASEALHPEIALALENVRSGTEPEVARQALTAAERDWGPSASPDRACQHLELARAFLRVERSPEARAEVRRAEAHLPEAAEWREVASYYASEAMILDGRRERDLVDRYRALEDSRRKTLALAARLRRLDLEQDWPLPSPTVAEQREFQGVLDAARDRGLDLGSWSARAAEYAIAAGRMREAHRWLADAERVEDRAGIATIRKADVLLATKRREDARRALRRVGQSGALRAARDLARIRLADFDLLGETVAQRLQRLQPLTDAEHPSVRTQARDARLQLLLDADRVDTALSEITRLARDSSPPFAKPRFRANLDRGLATAGSPDAPCAAVVERLGNQREVFLRLASEPEPLLVLGDCLVELGLAPAGLDVYRGLARRFGIGVGQLGLRIAKASMTLNRVAALRASLRAQRNDKRPTATGKREALEWRWLEARLAFLESRNADAQKLLLELLGEEELSDAMRLGIESSLSSLVKRGDGTDGALDLDTISVALMQSLARPLPEEHDEDRGETWLTASDLLRERGREVAARSAYLRASELLPNGPRRSRARFYASVDEGQRAPNDIEPSLWVRLSRARVRVDDLQDSFRGEAP